MNSTMVLITPPALAERYSLNFPTNATVISGALKQSGFRTKMIDLNLEVLRKGSSFFDDSLSYSLRLIEDNVEQVDFFGITTLCSNYPLVLQLASRLKKKYRKPVILCGPQATMTATRTMEFFPSIDYIVAHEGEVTIVELLKCLCDDRDPKDVQGIFYRRNGQVYATAPRPFIDNLDDSPFPDFTGVDIKAYQDLYPDMRIPVDTGRGCPFNCTFCCTSMMWKRSFRMKSPQRALAEMNALHDRFGISYFFLTQDNLTTEKSYVLELCAALKGKNYTWECYSRCDTLDDEMLEVMHSAGCRHIGFGIETGSERYQKIIKKNLNLANAENAMKSCVKHGVEFTSAYIIGFPEENREDIALTLKSCFRDAARTTRRLFFNMLCPMPGTELTSNYFDRLISPLAMQLDFSPFLLKNESAQEARKMITAYPDIFSSFYFIKPTHFDPAELFDIKCFYGLLIDEFPRTTHLMLQYSSLPLLDLLDLYRKKGRPLKPEEMTAGLMSDYFSEIIAQYAVQLGKHITLIKELLSYELAIYQVRTTPTPEGLLESQGNAATIASKNIEPEFLSFTPTLIVRSFKVDIDQVLKSLAVENHDYALLQAPLEIIFYEDAVNSDIIQERLDSKMKTLLDDLREKGFQNIRHSREQLWNLIKKGVLIYRKKPPANGAAFTKTKKIYGHGAERHGP